ncbi:Mus7/MMS22 family-domain-containing protein [Pyrenochaeta sp. MPI-SDFR-AT-0127]|nr:Mus7/MMS22 family-domain-containing protein [Pyrenochaeta sp. MPI-SDFR-AT-0127]
MSRWRQKGFVLDSDEEEEESQAESQKVGQYGGDGRVERADIDRNEDGKEAGFVEDPGNIKDAEISNTPTRCTFPKRPTPSPFTPSPTIEPRRHRTESPDPLQRSPIPNVHRVRLSSISYDSDFPALRRGSPSPETQRNDDVAVLSQILDNATVPPRPLGVNDVGHITNASKILGEFGIAPLSDDSEDDSLSDPPSDLESPPTAFVTPHRRTAVQVIIPSSTALQKHIAEQRSRRDFRQRKPIQLHPYALEGELYRREVQSRGLKPVPRERSPQRPPRHDAAETQENEFNPDRSPSSSPPEIEISVSTPDGQRRRKVVRRRSSLEHSTSAPTRCIPSTQTHSASSAKRRKLNTAQTQVTRELTSIFDDDALGRGMWSIPPNSPPYSSSPPLNGTDSARRIGRLRVIDAAPNLPTPSTSSVFQDEPQQLPDLESGPISRSLQRSGKELRRTARIILSDSPSSASESLSDEQSDNELKKVGRKIKGVLPASWLRFDRQTQERRSAQQRERERARWKTALSPEPTEPQRGVAQRVTKRAVRSAGVSLTNSPSRDIVAISDDSDNEPSLAMSNHAQHVQNSAQDASSLAAMFDSRYADDNLSDMENDRLHLPTLGGTDRRRKKQIKLTDTFEGVKRVRHSNRAGMAVRYEKRPYGGARGSVKHVTSRSECRPSPPAMSVIDMDISPSRYSGDIPQFLKIARRQALRRHDLARQHPSTKHIRLHNARDTEDAILTLQQWRQGNLKPKTYVEPRQQKTRYPLANKEDNQQRTEKQSTIVAGSVEGANIPSTTKMVSRPRNLQIQPANLRIFQRSSTRVSGVSERRPKTPKSSARPIQLIRNFPLPVRAAQLEGDETEFGHGHRKIAFEKGLHRVDQEFGVTLPQHQPNANPVLARFLADEDTDLPPLPSAKDIGERPVSSPILEAHLVRRRLTRKPQARRVDVDTREYRQPSEPAVEDIVQTMASNQEIESEQDLPVLQGLGPYGTRYPVTFDVYSLATETYFHCSTFIGSDELQQALSTGKSDGRSLDEHAGYCSVVHDAFSVRCGPWNDQTNSDLHNLVKTIWAPLDGPTHDAETDSIPSKELLEYSVSCLRSLITYLARHLSFLDSIDRTNFVTKMTQLITFMMDRLFNVYATFSGKNFASYDARTNIRAFSYLLVLSVQTHRIAQHENVDSSQRSEILGVIRVVAKVIVTHLIRHSISELSNFLESNKRHATRMNGIQEADVLTESIVVCIHALDSLALPALRFWSIVNQELSFPASKAVHTRTLESIWATIFTFLPFVGVDVSGIPLKDGKLSFHSDDWAGIRDLLKRLFELYPSTARKHSSSLNDYVRANLERCHRLIHYWHWQRPEQMLNTVIDFFGKNGLRQLRREASTGSVPFLEHATIEKSLTLLPNENSFHITLKCLALGLRGMKDAYPEKKLRSFVFRTIPNHGRTYPKDQPLDEESLAALRNHHDLLSTLYWAAPPPCRPKLDHIRHLVNHENSHREACRLSVRAWANLTAFQFSTEEPYASAKPFALWHKDILHHTLRQYRLARIEADEYIKSGILDRTSDVSAVMVRQTMEKNQEQVIATLRDCIAGMNKALQDAKDQTSLKAFLIDSDIVHLLELPHLEDRRLVNVIRDVLELLRGYARSQDILSTKEITEQRSEESQDYGGFPDLDDLDEINLHPSSGAAQQSSFDFVQSPLWHLLSNVFGAESSPDDNLLMDCIDTWISIAHCQVKSGLRSWSYYIDSFSPVSWQQLRRTEQTRKFGPYFMAILVESDLTAYEEHRQDFITALLLSLVDRESMLRFQHRLLHVIARTDPKHPLMKNLPFFRSQQNGIWDITLETVRTRRLPLLSSMLSNMRDDLQATALADLAHTAELRRHYAAVLKDFMTTMKSNYQQLRQGTAVTGTYVEFVQKIIQFLKQYTGDICPVLPFFTDSVAFPLPAADPTYVVGRLCGYAPSVTDTGTAKQLSVFIQTVAQQAAADNQQSYLVNQLTTALSTDEAPATDRAALRSVLIQGVFPAYIEKAFWSRPAFIIARPILQSLPSILRTMIFDLRITQQPSLSSIVGSITAVLHAFMRGIEPLKDEPIHFRQPHILSALGYLLEAMILCLPLLEYIWSRTSTSTFPEKKPSLVTYMADFSLYVAEVLHGMVPHATPSYEGDVRKIPAEKQTASLLAFCMTGLEGSITANWSENAGFIWFGQGYARREVVFDMGSLEVEKARLIAMIEAFHGALCITFGNEHHDHGRGHDVGNDIIV